MSTLHSITLETGETFEIEDKKAREQKMDKANAQGSGTFSLNRKEDTIVGEYSATLNKNNSAAGIGATAAGQDNEANADSSFVSGSGNITSVAAKNSFISGEQNVVTGSNSLTTGFNNKNNSKNGIVSGSENIVMGDHSQVFGQKNTASTSATGNLIGGAGNTSNSPNSIIEGSQNTIAENSSDGAVFGHGNTVRGNYSTAAGRNVSVDGDCSVAIGENLQAKANQTIFGKYNKNDIDDLFEIGDGTSDNPHNVMWIGKDGNVYISKNVFFDTDSGETKSLASIVMTGKATKEVHGIVRIGNGIDVDDGLITAEVQQIIVVDDYDPKYNYNKNDYCMYNYTLKKCISKIDNSKRTFNADNAIQERGRLLARINDNEYSTASEKLCIAGSGVYNSKRYVVLMSDDEIAATMKCIIGGNVTLEKPTLMQVAGADIYCSFVSMDSTQSIQAMNIFSIDAECESLDDLFSQIYMRGVNDLPYTASDWKTVQIMDIIYAIERELEVPAQKTRFGRVTIGNGIDVDKNGLISLTAATDKQRGGVTIGRYITLTGDKISIEQANRSTFGVVKIGEGLERYNDYTRVAAASDTVCGGIRVGNFLHIDGNRRLHVNIADYENNGVSHIGRGLFIADDGLLESDFVLDGREDTVSNYYTEDNSRIQVSSAQEEYPKYQGAMEPGQDKYWAPAEEEKESWIRLQLDEPVYPTEIRFYYKSTYKDNSQFFVLEASNAGIEYVPLTDRFNISFSKDEQRVHIITDKLNENAEHRYKFYRLREDYNRALSGYDRVPIDDDVSHDEIHHWICGITGFQVKGTVPVISSDQVRYYHAIDKRVEQELFTVEDALNYILDYGGNAREKEMTYEEYLALPEEDKMDGTNFFITDISEIDDEGNVTLEQNAGEVPALSGRYNYSTKERAVGTWIDGSKIYEIVLPCQNSLNQQIDVSNLNIKMLIGCDAIGSDQMDYAGPKWTLNAVSGIKSREIYFDNNNLFVKTDGLYFHYIIIRYTKNETEEV